MLRRDFLRRSASGLAATWIASKTARSARLVLPPPTGKYRAHDDVVLGRTGIRTSRLAMGTGTIGGGGESNQTRLGTSPFVTLMLDGYHENGLRFFDTADSYGSHPYVAAAIKQLPRDKVTVLTKTDHRDPKEVRADLDRFRRELGTDYIDILLIHCVTADDWTTRYRGVMDVLSEAKQKGIIRAHGVSCHSIGHRRQCVSRSVAVCSTPSPSAPNRSVSRTTSPAASLLHRAASPRFGLSCRYARSRSHLSYRRPRRVLLERCLVCHKTLRRHNRQRDAYI
jgi:hypothetical protein